MAVAQPVVEEVGVHVGEPEDQQGGDGGRQGAGDLPPAAVAAITAVATIVP